nr:hypothetical protein [Tanacetum cinerariifolium]
METLQLRVASLLDNGNRSLEPLNEMDRALNIRWTLASMKRKLAILKKQEGEASAAVAVAYEEMQTEKLILESKRLKQEAAETSKIRSRDSRLLSKTSAKHIKDVRTKNKLRGSRMIKKVKRKAKLHGTRMSAKSVKKVKIKTKLHGNRVFGQINKKMKIKGGVHGTRMSAKIKKENNGSFEPDIKIGPAVADITEAGQGKSTECSEDTYAEGLALGSTMKKETGQRSRILEVTFDEFHLSDFITLCLCPVDD